MPRILVVDDTETSRYLGEVLQRDIGAEVDLTQFVNQALDFIVQHDYNL